MAYVGMTRARQLLYLTCLRQHYDFKNGAVDVEPSAFVHRLALDGRCVVKGDGCPRKFAWHTAGASFLLCHAGGLMAAQLAAAFTGCFPRCALSLLLADAGELD